MKPVVTITLGPVVDKSTQVDQIIPDKKLRCEHPEFDPGGGGINVSRALKRLEGHSVAVYPAGGATGELLYNLLSEEGITQKRIPTESWTRENFIVSDKSSDKQYRFGMPGVPVSEEEAGKILEAVTQLSFSDGFIVLSGSFPPGIGKNFIRELNRITARMKAKLVVDTSGQALQDTAEQGVYLLKPNLGELSALSGAESLDDGTAVHAAKNLIDQGKAEIIVISMGPRGAYLVTKDLSEHFKAPVVKTQSTVGAGDSMVAGMIHTLAQGKDFHEMVRMGIACGTAATMNPGTELFRKEDVERLYKWCVPA